MAERIGKNLWRLDIPLVGNPLKNLNSYLLTGPRSLLIDTGFRQDPCRAAMERQLEEIGVDPSAQRSHGACAGTDPSGVPGLHRPGGRRAADGAGSGGPVAKHFRGVCAERVFSGGDGAALGYKSCESGGTAALGWIYLPGGWGCTDLWGEPPALRAHPGAYTGASVSL